MPASDRARLTIVARPWRGPDSLERVPAPFRASWPHTLAELQDELSQPHWGAGSSAVVARPPVGSGHPGVVVQAMGLVLRCDHYGPAPGCRGDTANLRAIVRTLTAFRQIARDGVSVSAQGADHLSPGALLAT